jgi:hypothetical protein
MLAAVKVSNERLLCREREFFDQLDNHRLLQEKPMPAKFGLYLNLQWTLREN